MVLGLPLLGLRSSREVLVEWILPLVARLRLLLNWGLSVAAVRVLLVFKELVYALKNLVCLVYNVFCPGVQHV